MQAQKFPESSGLECRLFQDKLHAATPDDLSRSPIYELCRISIYLTLRRRAVKLTLSQYLIKHMRILLVIISAYVS